MTYREMMERDHPEEVCTCFIGGCSGCPGNYYSNGPIPYTSCDGWEEERCTECWDMEADSTDDAPQEKRKTNGDRIRAMSDEDLAKYLYCTAHSNFKPLNENLLLIWLKGPVEE